MEIFVILSLIFIVAYVVCRFVVFKIPKVGNMVLITGGIKTGKSTLSVRMVYKLWKKQCFKVRVINVLYPILGVFFSRFRQEKKPMPLIYSNVPLSIPYVPLTEDLIMRKKRFVYGSVCYIQECSLLADSMSYKDQLLNENMLLLCKLWAHETKGGYIILDTQSVQDNHYSIKRCLNSYIDIHHAIKLPFVILLFVRELKYDDSGNNVNVYDDDVEDTLRCVVVPKSTWKMFDRYCYSILTDNLPVIDKVVERDKNDLKADYICSFKPFITVNKKYKGEENDK